MPFKPDREPELPSPESVILNGIKERVLLLAEAISLKPEITKGNEASNIVKASQDIMLAAEKLSTPVLSKKEILQNIIDELGTKRPDLSVDLARLGKDLFKF